MVIGRGGSNSFTDSAVKVCIRDGFKITKPLLLPSPLSLLPPSHLPFLLSFSFSSILPFSAFSFSLPFLSTHLPRPLILILLFYQYLSFSTALFFFFFHFPICLLFPLNCHGYFPHNLLMTTTWLTFYLFRSIWG